MSDNPMSKKCPKCKKRSLIILQNQESYLTVIRKCKNPECDFEETKSYFTNHKDQQNKSKL